MLKGARTRSMNPAQSKASPATPWAKIPANKTFFLAHAKICNLWDHNTLRPSFALSANSPGNRKELARDRRYWQMQCYATDWIQPCLVLTPTTSVKVPSVQSFLPLTSQSIRTFGVLVLCTMSLSFTIALDHAQSGHSCAETCLWRHKVWIRKSPALKTVQKSAGTFIRSPDFSEFGRPSQQIYLWAVESASSVC